MIGSVSDVQDPGSRTETRSRSAKEPEMPNSPHPRPTLRPEVLGVASSAFGLIAVFCRRERAGRVLLSSTLITVVVNQLIQGALLPFGHGE